MPVKLLKYPLLVISIAFTAGILIQELFNFFLPHLIIFFSLLIVLLFISRGKVGMIPTIFLVFLVAGCIRFKLWDDEQRQHPILQYAPLQLSAVEGRIVSPPVNHMGIVNIEEALSSGTVVIIKRNFLFRTSLPLPVLKPGDRIRWENIQLAPLQSPRNPGEFNFSRYSQYNGVIGEIRFLPQSTIIFQILKSSWNFNRLFFNIREQIDYVIFNSMQNDAAAFMSAILLGNRKGLPLEIKTDFQNSGVAHVLAISGLHVGFIAYLIFIILSFLPISFRWQNNMTILILFFYMLVTGANPPVVRASLMISLYLMGNNLERKPVAFNVLGTALLVILLFHPQQLFWMGFQFSFAAVFSILFFYQKLLPVQNFVLSKLRAGTFIYRLIKSLCGLFLVSLAAQFGTLPLVVFYFQQIPVVSILLNLPVIPAIGIIIPIGFMLIVTGLGSVALASLIGNVLSQLVLHLFKLVHFAANLPLAYFAVPGLGVTAFLAYLVIMGLVFNYRSWVRSGMMKPAVIIIILLILFHNRPTRYGNQILMLDVGQGDAFLVTTPTGKRILIDAGPVSVNWDSGTRVILPVLKFLGKLHLDKVIISHPHSDHLGGILSLLNTVTVDSVYFPDLKTADLWQDSLLKNLKERFIPYRALKSGDMIPLDYQSKFYCFSPSEKLLHPETSSGKSINNISLVILLKISDSSALFTGDVEKDVEQQLLGWGSLLQADILKIGHHGSNTSSSDTFLERINPEISLISVGSGNKFDHPSPLVIEKLNTSKIKIFRTDRDGAVWLQREQRNWKLVQWR